jgi:5-bromo-4-chloroindolyl phosphate hydrolysis protein
MSDPTESQSFKNFIAETIAFSKRIREDMKTTTNPAALKGSVEFLLNRVDAIIELVENHACTTCGSLLDLGDTPRCQPCHDKTSASPPAE